MTQLKQRYMDYTQTERDGRLPVLDGARTLFVLIVGAYHIWQQSWLTPAIPWFGERISLDFLMRSGYIWVDALLLLSGFLLYLPYAEANEDGKSLPRVLPFYRNRLLRIAPSYYLNVLIMLFFVALPRGLYNSASGTLDSARLTKDLLAHATFTHNLFPFSYTGSPLNGTLWTLGVEMQFYLLFPFIARCFGKKPLLTYLAMAGIGVFLSLLCEHTAGYDAIFQPAARASGCVRQRHGGRLRIRGAQAAHEAGQVDGDSLHRAVLCGGVGDHYAAQGAGRHKRLR